MKKIFVLCCIVTGILFFSCTDEKKETIKTEHRTAVHVSPVVSGKASFPVYASGMLSMKDTVKLSFKTGGVIRQMYADEGAFVGNGALLASLDLSEINARVAQAKSAYDRAKREYDRIKRLYEENVATLQNFQDAETALSVAGSDLSVIEFNQIHSSIYAPAPGRILKRMASSNELIGPGMPVFLFAATNKNWILRFGVSDRDLISLTIGDTAEVMFDVYPNEVFSGWISEIAEMADPYTGTFEIELAVNNPENKKLVAGFIGKAVILPSRKESLSLVSIDAVVEGSGSTAYVYIADVESGTVKLREITIRKILDEYVAVSSGVTASDIIVTVGAPYLRDDALINIIKKENPEITAKSGIIFENQGAEE